MEDEGKKGCLIIAIIAFLGAGLIMSLVPSVNPEKETIANVIGYIVGIAAFIYIIKEIS